ncbi:MAG: hypothetical protein AB7O26_13240 [Planctomycetaceae bacterium]
MNLESYRPQIPDLPTPVDGNLLNDQRAHPRRVCSTCITAVPVDESGTAIDSLLVGHCLDVSDGGIKITLARSTTARYLKVEPNPPTSELGFSSAIIEVLRRSHEEGCFTYAGRRIETLPGRTAENSGS